MKQIEEIESRAIEKYGSFRQYCLRNGYEYSNFKRKLIINIEKINKWLSPLGLKIKITWTNSV